MQKKKLPKIIKELGFNFSWDEGRVWKLDVPAEEMDISELEWNFDIPFWSTEGGYFDLKPREVVENKDKYKKEYKRIMDSDLNFPLDVMRWRGKLLFLDGLHRLVKAKILGHKKVRVRKIPQKDISKIKK